MPAMCNANVCAEPEMFIHQNKYFHTAPFLGVKMEAETNKIKSLNKGLIKRQVNCTDHILPVHICSVHYLTQVQITWLGV